MRNPSENGVFFLSLSRVNPMMLTLPPDARVFVATARLDGRERIDGLSLLVRSQFAEDPLSGTMYVFFCAVAIASSSCTGTAMATFW